MVNDASFQPTQKSRDASNLKSSKTTTCTPKGDQEVEYTLIVRMCRSLSGSIYEQTGTSNRKPNDRPKHASNLQNHRSNAKGV